MIEIIRKVDDVWHDSDKELPTMSTDVEFMDKNGIIHKNCHIQVDMAGHYALDENNYSSFDYMVKWRFIPGKKYIMYENLKN